MADNAYDNVDFSENSSDERRHKRKKSICMERSSQKKSRRISSTSARDSSREILRVIQFHPAPAAMRSNEARKGKRNIRKGNQRNVVELNLPLQRPVVFVQ